MSYTSRVPGHMVDGVTFNTHQNNGMLLCCLQNLILACAAEFVYYVQVLFNRSLGYL